MILYHNGGDEDWPVYELSEEQTWAFPHPLEFTPEEAARCLKALEEYQQVHDLIKRKVKESEVRRAT